LAEQKHAGLGITVLKASASKQHTRGGEYCREELCQRLAARGRRGGATTSQHGAVHPSQASRRAHAPLKSSAASTRCATPPSTSEDPLSASVSASVSVAGVTYSSSESYLQRQEDVQTMAYTSGAASATIKGMMRGHPNAPPTAVAALELARLLLTLNEGLLLQGACPRTSAKDETATEKVTTAEPMKKVCNTQLSWLRIGYPFIRGRAVRSLQ
jgi:hypothetical protein